MLLTLGTACANDPHGLRWTLQILFNHHRQMMTSGEIEFIVIDNADCKRTQAVAEKYGVKCIVDTSVRGTAYPRDLLFRKASGRFVGCMDCHIDIYPGVLGRLADYLNANPDSRDMLQGPLMTERGGIMWTEFIDHHPDGNERWGDGMLGQGHAREHDPAGPGFEIQSQGLFFFVIRKDVFLEVGGFNPAMRGFGGEEGYIHEKIRRAGGKCLCLPWMKAWHAFKFGGEEPPYPALRLDMFKNYLHIRKELDIDATTLIQHYSSRINPLKMAEAIREVYGDGTVSQGTDASGSGDGGADSGHAGTDSAERCGEETVVSAQGELSASSGNGDGRDVVLPGDDSLQSLRRGIYLDGGRTGDRGPAGAGPRSYPIVSCIMSTFNRCPKWQHLIEESVQSFLQQTYPAPFRELVILNDTPGQRLVCDIPGVRVINLDERLPSLSGKINRLHDIAKGQIILAWDDDDISLPNRITQAVGELGDADWWNPKATWYYAKTAGGPEGTGLHYKHHHGYCLNASAWRASAWKKIGGCPNSSDCDRVIHRILSQPESTLKIAPALPANRPDLWQYIYRWGVQPIHISGRGDCQSSYDFAGQLPKVCGEFTLNPYWRENYELLVSEKIAEWQAENATV